MEDFKIKTSIYFGEGSLERLSHIGNKNVLIITDPFMVKSGTINKITDKLVSASVTVFSEIIPDPPIELVVKGIEELNKVNPEVIVALGGGSAIDAAKAIMDFSKNILSLKNIEFIAIPTTSGTGSEVTSFSVITDKEKGVKYPLVSEKLIPNIAILDPELVKTVPPAITADTGMDVITHGLEAYVSTKANDFTDALAEKSLMLAFKYLEKAYKDGSDMEAREKMHNASCLAGIAFNSASLGINHSIAHTLGGKFHVPHGRTNAMLLPYVIEYNANIVGYDNKDYSLAAKKYHNIAKLLGLPSNNIRMGVKNLINLIKTMEKNMKMPLNLKECGVDTHKVAESLENIAESAFTDACTPTNPRIPTKEDIMRIVEKVKE
ncbi:iron-containing alcohol dehydrogenase [Clostridium cadaveris]|uniref:1-propanol dehydrogenase PduQ n=1 Tax=Clostridium cadaveris TaxID=1529 RepID=UPI001E6081CE|nr:1-propanol dehydrogenase PduQ [Clostridium cadaveris]UFH66038.1 iron-containing alcohol dehydrogenase [Clostridium cadaveris]